VEAQASLDRMFEPFEKLLVEAVAGHAARRVLDLGCGTGATTLAIARRLGVRGEATGLDISAPMIALARSRAALSRTRDAQRESGTAGAFAGTADRSQTRQINTLAPAPSLARTAQKTRTRTQRPGATVRDHRNEGVAPCRCAISRTICASRCAR
jgi:hypothetical protein